VPKNKNPLEDFVRELDFTDVENRRYDALDHKAQELLYEAQRLRRKERLRKLLKELEEKAANAGSTNHNQQERKHD
jgi:hypothetical protein